MWRKKSEVTNEKSYLHTTAILGNVYTFLLRIREKSIQK